MRTVLEWLISRKVDDGLPLGTVLSWMVHRDLELERFYESLKTLEVRLQSDAAVLLEYSTRNSRPIKLVRNCVGYSVNGQVRRRQRHGAIAAMLILFFFGTGLFFSGGFGFLGENSQTLVAAPHTATDPSVMAPLYSDPDVYEELLQLCR